MSRFNLSLLRANKLILRRSCKISGWHRIPDDYRHSISLWLLRLLNNTSSDEVSIHIQNILEIVGLRHLKLRSFRSPKAMKAMAARLNELEHQPLSRTGTLYKNIKAIAERVGLTELEQDVLAFSSLLRRCPILKDCAESLWDEDTRSIFDLLAVVMRVDQPVVDTIFSRSGRLASSGLLTINYSENHVTEILDLIDGLERTLFDEQVDQNEPFSLYFRLSQPPRHSIDDFSYLAEDIAMLTCLLANAFEQRQRGFNVLLYGESGIGKTEFVRSLVASIGASLYEVAHETPDADLKQQQFRFRAYQFGQKVLSHNSNGVILFDEIEDVFSDHYLSHSTTSSGPYKAWTNAVLESNMRPAFWLSNNIQSMDRAFLRRYSVIIEFRSPPRSVRRQLLMKELRHGAVRSEWIERISSEDALSVAAIKDIAGIAAVLPSSTPKETECFISRAIEHKLRLMGHSVDLRALPSVTGMPYGLEFLNASEDIEKIAMGLAQRPIARLCLHGPPGTGKTAFGEYLAKELDRPLIEKKASDLLSCWVGMTERNLAAAFNTASEEGALLFLDEADSLIQDRLMAHHSWERTQVNELLKQMERFDGILVCSTNQIDIMDSAVLRRFDFKIKFSYLKPEQAWTLFIRAFMTLCEVDVDYDIPPSVALRLELLDTLAVGDFATVLRQAKILGKGFDLEWLLAALEAECQFKRREKTAVKGFKFN